MKVRIGGLCWSGNGLLRAAGRLAAILLAVAALNYIPREVRAGKPAPSTTNVTTTVQDTDAGGGLLLFRSDDFNGSGGANYTGVNNIQSYIDSTGIWRFNLYGQKTGARTVFVTPDLPVGTEPTAPPANYYWKNVEVTSKCTDSSGNTVPFSSLVNGSSTCGFMVDFNYNGIVYKLLLGRVLNASDPTPGDASVGCNGLNGSGQCVNWTITAGDSASGAVANLYSYTGRRSAPWVFIGQYYNSVRVHVTNP